MAEESVKETVCQQTASSTAESSSEKPTLVVEGKRMTLFRKALDKVIDKCLTSVTSSDFQKCYPNTKRKQLDQLKNQFISSLREAIKAEMEVIYEEEQLVKLLNSLDDLDNAAAGRQEPAWRPSGDASEDIQAHLIPVYIQQRDRLQKINERYNRENSRLQRQVQTQRRRLLENQTTASTKCDSLLQSAEEVEVADVVPQLLQIKQLLKQNPHLLGQ